MIRKMNKPMPMEDFYIDPLLRDRVGDSYEGEIRAQRLNGFDADNHREMIHNLDEQMKAPAADNSTSPKIEQIGGK